MQASIVIPTLDAGPEFEHVLEAIAQQAVSEPPDLVVVDSGSRDGTRERAARHGARVYEIRREAFNHGATRNLGIEKARGELVVLLTQDARPRDERWLAELLAPLADPRVAGAYSRVVPRPDATPLVKRSVEADLVFSTQSRRTTIDDLAAWPRLPARDRRIAEHFNNVSSCVRRSTLREVPFPPLRFGEDIAWAGRMLRGGQVIVYQPTSVVEHSHPSRLRTDFARHRDDARLRRILFDDFDGAGQQARSFAGEVLRDLRCLAAGPRAERLRHGAYSPWLRGAQALGRWVGSCQAGTTQERATLRTWQESSGRSPHLPDPASPQRDASPPRNAVSRPGGTASDPDDSTSGRDGPI